MGLGSVWFGHMALFVRSFVLICLLWQTREDRFGSMCSLTCRLLGILLCPYCVTSSIDERNVMSKNQNSGSILFILCFYTTYNNVYIYFKLQSKNGTRVFYFQDRYIQLTINYTFPTHFCRWKYKDIHELYYSLSFKTFKCSMLYTNVFPVLTSSVII